MKRLFFISRLTSLVELSAIEPLIPTNRFEPSWLQLDPIGVGEWLE